MDFQKPPICVFFRIRKCLIFPEIFVWRWGLIFKFKMISWIVLETQKQLGRCDKFLMKENLSFFNWDLRLELIFKMESVVG